MIFSFVNYARNTDNNTHTQLYKHTHVATLLFFVDTNNIGNFTFFELGPRIG